MKKFKVYWEKTDLTATVEADSKEEVYGMTGLFNFDQGGSGSMPLPLLVEEINTHDEPTNNTRGKGILIP